MLMNIQALHFIAEPSTRTKVKINDIRFKGPCYVTHKETGI